MEDFYGQFDESLNSVLQELKSYVIDIQGLAENNKSINQYEYTDAILEERLLKYDDNKVILELERLLAILYSITSDKIKKAIPDDDWGDGEIVSHAEERQALIQGKKVTQDFIRKLIDKRRNLSNPVKKEFLNISVAKRNLNSMKESLIQKGMIEQTPYFAEILQGAAPDERINWIKPKSHFNHFIKKLHEELSMGRINWTKVANSFNINGENITSEMNLKSNNGKISKNDEKEINSAISYLTD
jgi:hypothetical protein